MENFGALLEIIGEIIDIVAILIPFEGLFQRWSFVLTKQVPMNEYKDFNQKNSIIMESK